MVCDSASVILSGFERLGRDVDTLDLAIAALITAKETTPPTKYVYGGLVYHLGLALEFKNGIDKSSNISKLCIDLFLECWRCEGAGISLQIEAAKRAVTHLLRVA